MGSWPQLSLRAYKTAWLAPELLVSMGSSLHLWFCAFKTATLGEKLQVSMGPRPHMWFSACKTACLASELLVSMGPSPHVWFLDAKQRDLRQNDKSIWVPALICAFFNLQNSDFRTRLTSLYGSRPHLWFWGHITACLAQEEKDSMGSSPHVWYCEWKSATLAHEIQVSVSQPSFVVFGCKTAPFWPE